MSDYTINLTDPLSPSFTVEHARANGPGNTSADTTLRLYGAGYPNWGEVVNENFVKLLEQFAGATPPQSPIPGQAWYRIELYQHDTTSTEGDGWWFYDLSSLTWMVIGETGTIPSSATPPLSPAIGDYYFNTVEGILYRWDQAYDGTPLQWLERAHGEVNLMGGAPIDLPIQTLMVADTDYNWVAVTLATVSTVAPTAPAAGTLWLDSVADTLKIWNGASWVTLINADNAVMTGNLDMSNNRIVNLADPINPTDALNLQTGDARYVNVTGDTMTGDLALGGNQLTFTHMSFNDGDGSVNTGPDINFSLSGSVAAENHFYINIDSGNTTTGDFTVEKGALTPAGSTPLFTVFNTGEIRARTTSYETLVVNNNSVPNKKYVDDAIGAIPGKQTISIPATALRPRGTNGCAFLATTLGAANQPDIDFLAYDGDVVEYSKITIPMPDSWDEGPVTASFQWKRASGTSVADVVWGVRAVALNNGSSTTTTFSSATVTDAAEASATIVSISGETTPLIIAGTPLPGGVVMFEFFRLSTDAADTMASEDAHLISVQVHYTTNALNDA